MPDFIIAGPKIYAEQGIIQRGSLVIEGGKIVSIEENDNATLRFPEHYYLVPGFIDLHVHGANHSDVMDGTEEALTTISQALAMEGTTSFLATTMTSSPAKLERALKAIHAFKLKPNHGANILGVHLEGPFISSKKAGAQCAEYILQPDIERFQYWQQISNNLIKLVTLAPELEGALPFIQYLEQQNIVVSMGHSDANYQETLAAITHGCEYATHLFNAMRGIHQREPGLVTAALLENIFTEVIADGVHLHPAILRLILKLKQQKKIILVTDAMRAKCLADGCYELGEQAVEVKQGVARLPDGTLAGSLLKMPDAIRNMMQFAQCDFLDALKMATENPAKALGVFHKKGGIAVGKDADCVILDDEFNVVLTMCEGKIAFQRESS